MSQYARLANKNLCARLYKLTGRNDTYYWRSKSTLTTSSNKSIWVITEHQANHESIPAYDIDYLFDELLKISEGYNLNLYYSFAQKLWRCSIPGAESPVEADTPADALCKMVIRVYGKFNKPKEVLRLEDPF